MAIRTFEQLEQQAKHWQHESARLPSGERVRFAFWEVTQPRGHVLIVPGRCEQALKYTEIASEWADRGVASLCLSPRSDVHDFQHYKDEFDYVFNTVFLPNVQNDFAFVQGHSTGAHVAARCLATGHRHIKGAEALILSAPLAGMNYRTPHLPDWVGAGVTSLMGLLQPDKPALGQKDYNRESPKWQFDGNPWTSDPQRFGWMLDMFDHYPAHAPQGAKWGWVRAAQQSCHQLAKDLKRLEIPQLVLATPNDRVVSGPAQRRFERATFIDFPESGHEIFMERDAIRNRCWSAIDDFLFKVRQNRAPQMP